MEQKIKALLARIVHPESGRNIVESGMVEHIDAGEGRVTVTLRFEKARDPFAVKIKRQVEEAIARELSLDREHVAVIVREAAPKAAPAASQHTFTVPRSPPRGSSNLNNFAYVALSMGAKRGHSLY